MTTKQNQPPTREIGEAERALRANLDRLLEKAGRAFPEWTTMIFLAHGGSLTADALVERQRAGHITDEHGARAAIATLEAEGAVHVTSGGVSLTEAGHRAYDELRRLVAAMTASIFDELPDEDVETTRRTLSQVAQRASVRLSG